MAFPSHCAFARARIPALLLLLVGAACAGDTAAPAVENNDTIVQPPVPGDTAHPSGLLSYVAWDAGPRLYTVRADGTDKRLLLPSRFVTWVDWARDGRHLVAVTRAVPELKGAALTIVDPDSGTFRDILLLDTVRCPTWSPDGRKIAFVPAGDGSLAIVNADGTDLLHAHDDGVPESESPEYGPSWSPDGRRIAFHSRNEFGLAVWTIASDGTDLRALTSHEYAYHPRWSPNGEWILYTSYGTISATARIVRPDGLGGFALDTLVGWYSWSPDSRRVALAGRGLSVASPWEYGSVQVIPTTEDVRAPEWSPDGRWIAFTGRRDRYSLEVVLAEKGARRRTLATFGPGKYPLQLRWRPEPR